MPQEFGYRQQVDAPAPARLPDASPAAFGAGVGDGIAQVGSALQNAELRHRQIERQQTADSEAADFNARYATAREDADKYSIAMRNNAAPGGVGHADQMAKWWEDRKATLLDGITEDRVRRSAAAQIDEFATRLRTSEYQWQEGARVGKLVTDTKAATDIAANRARRNHDYASLSEELSAGRRGIEEMVGVPDHIRDQLIQDHEQSVSVAYLNGLTDSNPTAVQPLLDSGAFDAIITPEQAERLRNGAHAEIRSREAQARAQAAADKAQQQQLISRDVAQLENNAGKPQNWFDVAARQEAVGDLAGAVRSRAKGTEMQASLAYKGEPLRVLDQQIAGLDREAHAGGLSTEKASLRNGLVTLRKEKAARLNQPGGALKDMEFSTGQAITPLDPANPATFARRADQAAVAARMAGRPAIEPLIETDMPVFHDLMAKGANGKLQAIDLLSQFRDPEVRAGAVRQVGGDDPTFRVAAMLDRNVARDVLRASETLKANPGIWTPDTRRRAAHDFELWYGPALKRLGGTAFSDIQQAAMAYFIQQASDSGDTRYDAQKMVTASERVLGRTARGGGIAHWGGTWNGPVVILPRNMNAQQFNTSLARARFDDYVAAANGRRPRWPDGKDVSEGDLKRAVPSALPDGNYGFIVNGRLIHDDQHRPFGVDVQKLTR